MGDVLPWAMDKTAPILKVLGMLLASGEPARFTLVRAVTGWTPERSPVSRFNFYPFLSKKIVCANSSRVRRTILFSFLSFGFAI